jgi:hypothetical protein
LRGQAKQRWRGGCFARPPSKNPRRVLVNLPYGNFVIGTMVDPR